MDTLSSSFNVIPNRNPKSHGFHHFKNHHHLPQHSHLISRNPKLPNRPPSPFTTRHNSSIKLNPTTFLNPSQSADLSFKQPETFHREPSTGYAVALLDAARCSNSVREISRDVKRLSRWMSNDEFRATLVSPLVGKREKGEVVKEIVSKGHFHKLPLFSLSHQWADECSSEFVSPLVGKREKGELVKEIVSKGHFHKHLVRLVKLLAEKSRAEMIYDVLVEFKRVYDEMIGCVNSDTQVVLVSSEVKMEENQVLRMAKKVQKISGAERVKVRQLVDGRLPSFAV